MAFFKLAFWGGGGRANLEDTHRFLVETTESHPKSGDSSLVVWTCGSGIRTLVLVEVSPHLQTNPTSDWEAKFLKIEGSIILRSSQMVGFSHVASMQSLIFQGYLAASSASAYSLVSMVQRPLAGFGQARDGIVKF